MQSVRRLQRHKNGVEVRLPRPVCEEIGVIRGDYLLFDWEAGDTTVQISKVEGRDNGRTKVSHAR